MEKLLPKVGDYIECLIDIGNVTNSPWTSNVIEVTDQGYKVDYNDGDTVYEIPDDAFTDQYERNGKLFFVVDKESNSIESLKW